MKAIPTPFSETKHPSPDAMRPPSPSSWHHISSPKRSTTAIWNGRRVPIEIDVNVRFRCPRLVPTLVYNGSLRPFENDTACHFKWTLISISFGRPRSSQTGFVGLLKRTPTSISNNSLRPFQMAVDVRLISTQMVKYFHLPRPSTFALDVHLIWP